MRFAQRVALFGNPQIRDGRESGMIADCGDPEALKKENSCNRAYESNRHQCDKHIQQVSYRIVFNVVLHLSSSLTICVGKTRDVLSFLNREHTGFVHHLCRENCNERIHLLVGTARVKERTRDVSRRSGVGRFVPLRTGGCCEIVGGLSLFRLFIRDCKTSINSGPM